MEKPGNETQQINDPDGVTPQDSANGSLGDWINQAKRVHELVDAVDLTKVAAHDPLERDKLHTVSHALNTMAKGKKIDHVEGVDEVVPEIDEAQQRKSRLFELVVNGGWGERIGRVLCVSGDQSMLKPLELMLHQEGLPKFDLCIAPEQRLSYGSYGIFISQQGIFAASISEPASKYHWRVDRSRPYDSANELKRSISQFSQIDE